ncbi:MAG: GNAT family N-acetyltransferase [Candidatus Bathyarchaeota archaeon]|nr:GNAT family N-acetyltransferase [Candidatus Bathyarchaeota archaeon]
MSARTRRVTAADKPDILEISRLTWEGHDYLPLVLDDWLNGEDSKMYGVRVGEHVIAVANLRVIENGKTGWMEGLRVHPDHRRKGYADLLTQKLIEAGKQLHLQRLRYTTGIDNEASVRLAEKHGFTRLCEVGVLFAPRPRKAPKMKAHVSIREAEAAEVYALLQRKSNIIPHGVLVHDWKALDLSLEALQTIGKDSKFHISLKDDEISSLSFAYPRRRPDLMWTFTIYADGLEGTLSQFAYNLILSERNNCTVIMGTYDAKYEALFQKSKWIPKNRWITRLLLLERKMQ